MKQKVDPKPGFLNSCGNLLSKKWAFDDTELFMAFYGK